MTKLRVIGLLFFASSLLGGCAASQIVPYGADSPDAWKTRAEQTAYQETDTYDECVAFCRRLAQASPWAHYTNFGRSGEGRELPLLILSKNRAFTPAQAQRDGKLVMLVENCIHAGECCGKDACLALARDILITGARRDLLEHVNLLILPIFNVDGHERRGPYNRMNQDGPREMGWRVTAANLNLNRDFAKADAVEMQAWLRLWNAWNPDFFIDVHTTDGTDHRYDLFYSATTTPFTAAPVVAYMNDALLPPVLAALAADGHDALPYSGPHDEHDLSKGIQAWNSATPRYSHGYGGIVNRPSILIEAHAHKTYERRVKASYAMILHILEELNRAPEMLRAAIRQADRESIENRGAPSDVGAVAIQLANSEESADAEPIFYKAWETTFRPSGIFGCEIVEYSRQPLDAETRLYDKTRIVRSVRPPAAYLIPPQWSEVIARLDMHGIEYFRLNQPFSTAVDTCRFEDVKFPSQPYEGRFPPAFNAGPLNETRDFPAGTVVVPLNQRRAALVVHLLDPDGPDSLLRWGFFNAAFEYKEYATPEALEPIAQRMLAEDPNLKAEFEQKLVADEKFAQDSGARLTFFYQRSPYWDRRYMTYPIAWLTDEAALRELRNTAAQ